MVGHETAWVLMTGRISLTLGCVIEFFFHGFNLDNEIIWRKHPNTPVLQLFLRTNCICEARTLRNSDRKCPNDGAATYNTYFSLQYTWWNNPLVWDKKYLSFSVGHKWSLFAVEFGNRCRSVECACSSGLAGSTAPDGRRPTDVAKSFIG